MTDDPCRTDKSEISSAEWLNAELARTRTTPYTVTLTLTRSDWENLAAFRDAWNADRVRLGLPALTTAQTISKALKGAATWLAGKETP